MAVPSIFRIIPLGVGLTDPVEGPTSGGNIIEIYGGDFRLPTAAPPISAGPTGIDPPPPSVEVLFGGVAAPRVEVIRSNFLRVIPPPSPLQVVSGAGISSPEGAVDVEVRNIDDSGVLIPGESVTASGAYTYRRPGLTAADESCLRYIDQTFLLRWRRDTIENVLKGEHTEWDADTVDALNIISLAELPAIVLVGPDMPENTFYSRRHASEDILDDGTVLLRPPPRTVDLVYDVIAVSQHEGEMMALQQMIRDFIKKTTFLELDRDPDDSSKGTVRYEVDEVDGTADRQNRPNNSNIKSYSGTVVIKGVDIEGAPGFGNLRDRGSTATVARPDEPVSLDADAIPV